MRMVHASTLFWFWAVVVVVLLAFSTLNLVRFLGHVRSGRALDQHSIKFEQHPAVATNRILIAGDSVAVGVGATTPQKTIAGSFGRDFPNAEIVNVGVSGAETNSLIDQLQSVTGQKFSLVVLLIGANDIVHFSNHQETATELALALAKARELGGTVVLMPEGNIGNAPIFPRLAALLYTRRSRDLQRRFQVVATEHGAVFIDVFHERNDDPWRTDPHRFYASDVFHPADAGYDDWYRAIRREMQSAGIYIGE